MNDSPRKGAKSDYINMSFNPNGILKNPKASGLNQIQISKGPSQSVYTPIQRTSQLKNMDDPSYSTVMPSKSVMIK